MKYFLPIFVLLFSGCSLRPLYAPLGAAVGGGAGSLAGPMGAVVGSAGGAATGALLAGDQELKRAQDTITAISRGDVEGMLAAATGQQKGFVDQAMDTVYDFIKLCLLGIVLWNFVPLAYTWLVHRKQKNGNPKKA